MPNCELLSTCPYFGNATQDMAGMPGALKKEYCQGLLYKWCGRYLVYKAIETELMKKQHESSVCPAIYN
jgi:hypothetical protein